MLIAAAATLSLWGCDLNGTSEADSGRLIVRITDFPFPFDAAAEANVEIVRVELVGNDSTQTLVLSDSPQAFNLLELQDGVTATVADVRVLDGDWEQLRFIVAGDASVLMKDSTEYALKLPSGAETGIKLNLPDIDLSEVDDAAIVTVDFNVEHSFVVMGNPSTPAGIQGFLFKPVLKIESLEIDGEPVDIIDTRAVAAPGDGSELLRLDD